MLFTELNTNVLLYIYGCLDPIDSINLAQTCTRLRDVAQLHYKRYKIFNLGRFLFKELNEWNQDRHNCIDATTILKHIGPFIHVLEADLSLNRIGSDVRTSIRKYCVNVKTLNVYHAYSSIPFTAYFDWLRKLHLTKISLPIQHLFLIDIPEITTLEELYVQYGDCLSLDIAYGCVANILERNVNITCLRIQLMGDVKYEIFEKLECLKRLVLDIEYDETGEQLEKVAANLKMTTLEKVELNFDIYDRVDGLNEFLQNLSENALHLKHLSIAIHNEMLDTHTFAYRLLSLHLLNLTSLRWIDKIPNLYKEIPKIQPNLTHLDLNIYEGSDLDPTSGGTLPKPMEQIVFLIKNLEKLELLHIRFLLQTSISSALKDFLKESVLSQLFGCHSINRPTVTLRLIKASPGSYRIFRQVELDFRARKWTWKIMVESHLKEFVEHKSLLPFYEMYEETLDDLLAVQCFSGSASDLNAVKDEAIKWIDYDESMGTF